MLKKDYRITPATSGKKALELAEKSPQPDIILLDVSMPEMDGYETCQQLKANPNTHDIDVIFITSHDTIEEKLKGYDVGGSDYLIKPVQGEELTQKINLSIENKVVKDKEISEKTEAMDAAMIAISSAGELAVLVDFMRISLTVTSIEELIQLVVDSTLGYGLKSSVQFRLPWGNIHAGTTTPTPPLEKELLFRLRDTGSITEKGKRLILNYGNTSQIIKNLPDDEEFRGRLRDHLALLLETAESRLETLVFSQELAEMVTDSSEALSKIQTLQASQKEKALAIMDNALKELEASFLSYGLTEDQENALTNVVKNGTEETIANMEKGMEIDSYMQKVVDRLKHFSD
jgi:CheY-like chemotaxis protein